MRKICFLALLALIAGGCQSSKVNNDKNIAKPFPKSLAAVWEGYFSQIHWVVKFTEDGKIEYAKIPMGGQFVGPNSEYTFPGIENSTMYIKTGNFVVDYKPDGTLGVSIEIINFDQKIPAGRIEMKGTEFLIGKVDLEKGIWNATWFKDADYWLTPLGKERIALPESDDENEIVLKRLIRKNEPNNSMK